MSYFPPTGSVVAFQSQPSSLLVGASIVGLPPVNVMNTNLNVSGSVAAFVQGTPNVNVSGSVVTFQGTSPWIITGSVQTSGTTGNSSVQVLNFPANSSVSGTVGASVIGTIPVTMAGAWTHSVIGTYSDSFVASTVTGIPFMFKANVSSSIMQAVSPTFPLPTIGSVSGSVGVVGNPSISGTVNVGNLPTTQNVSGSVVGFQGTNPWTVVSSLAGGIFPVSGSVAATITNTNVNISGSVVSWAQSTNASVITVWKDSSILSVPVGSTISVIQAPSFVGTYAEDAGHTSGDKGLFSLNVRNDTLSSITSADSDYSPLAVGPTGEAITANAPLTKWVQGTASMLGGTPVSGGSVAVIAAQGASIFTYVTGVQIANASANNVWLRFDGGTSSIVGFTVAPANGGSNIILPNAWKTNANSAFTASISGVASVYLSVQGFISKT